MWKDEKTEYLRKNRDYGRLLSGDDAELRSRDRDRDRDGDRDGDDEDDDEISREKKQDYLDRRRRLKELERQKLTKGRNGFHANGSGEKDSRAGDHGKGHGSSSGRPESGLSSSKDKKKMPYDRSFGSFFGPSEPVVAKRIIDEARAREEAEIVAAREAKANREAERKRASANSMVGKSSKDKRPVPKPKPVDMAVEKARKLKEARDYSFLLDDTPLPPPTAQDKVPASAKPYTGRDSGKPMPSSTPLKRQPLPAKSGQAALGSEKPSLSSRQPQSQPKPSQSSRPSSSQAMRDNYSSERSAMQSKQRPSASKISSAGPGRPDPRREVDLKKEAAMRKLVAGSGSSNGGKNSSLDRRGPVLHDRRPASGQAMERRLAQATDRRLSQSTDRRPSQVTDRRPIASQPSERRPGTSQGLKKVSQINSMVRSAGGGAEPRRQVSASESGRQPSERRPGASQGLKKGSQINTTVRSAGGGSEPRRQVSASQSGRQSLQPKLGSKPVPRKASPDYSKARYSDAQNRDHRRDEARGRKVDEYRGREVDPRRRARSPSSESDERPRKKMNVNGKRAWSPSEEEDDDSFIDDDEDEADVSNIIRKMFRYDPSKYRREDDLDDRSMEVGFRTIQAEERKSGRAGRLEDARELALIEEEERAERARKLKKKRKLMDR